MDERDRDAVPDPDQDQGPDRDLSRTLDALSRELFALARAAAETDDFAAGAARARVLNERLTELWPRIEAAPAEFRPSLSLAWSEARLDVGYLLSGGELGTSLRLNQIVRERSG